jgi:hypothetical protein
MKNVRTVGIIGAIVTGAMLSTVGATAASAQPITVRSTTVAGYSTTARTMPISPTSGTTTPTGESSTDRIPIKPIVDWLKNNASSVIPALKTALRNSLNAFKNWWNGLATWIRAGINAIAQMTVQEMFSALWDYFFG